MNNTALRAGAQSADNLYMFLATIFLHALSKIKDLLRISML